MKTPVKESPSRSTGSTGSNSSSSENHSRLTNKWILISIGVSIMIVLILGIVSLIVCLKYCNVKNDDGYEKESKVSLGNETNA